MQKVKIITDSLSDLSKELYDEMNINPIPLKVNFKGDEKDYYDGEISVADIYKKAEETNVLPSTSAVSPQQFMKEFQKAFDEGYEQVFYVGSGSGISATYQNAILASKEFKENTVFISDSQSLSTGIGLLVCKAYKLSKEGKTGEEIKNHIDSLVPFLSVKFSIEYMDYLYHGGRCSGLAYFFGKKLKIHPIIRVKDNKLVVDKMPRGNYYKAMDVLINEFNNDLPNMDMEKVFITHSGLDDFDGAKYIYDKIVDKIPAGNLYISTAKCVVSSHCGPHTIGILYILNNK